VTPGGGRRRFGLWTLIFLVVANMVGAGVFTTSGFTLRDLGSPRLVVAAWIAGGLIALAGAVSYGRLARAMPESGGEYLFLSRAAHPVLGFIAGWVSLIAGFTGAIAFAATALESYVVPDAVRPAWLPADAVAIAVVVVGGLGHGLRPRVGAILQNTAVLLKLVLLAGFLGLAAVTAGDGAWRGGPLPDGPAGTWPLVAAFAGALVWISLSYSGFNAAVYVADEAEDVRRAVPRALVLATIAVTVLYVLLNAVFVGAPPADRVAGQADVAAVAAEWIGGAGVATLVRVIVAVALLTSVSSMLMAGPRVYAKMADDGVLPRLFRFRAGRPGAAVAAQVVLAVGLILVSSLQGLLAYLGLTLSLCAAMSVSCLFLPSVRDRPLLHASHAAPLVYVACTVAAAAIMTTGQPRQLLAAGLTFGVGVAAWLAVTRVGRPRA
jgi:APA family basic amino acid/polyamine antiporter